MALLEDNFDINEFNAGGITSQTLIYEDTNQLQGEGDFVLNYTASTGSQTHQGIVLTHKTLSLADVKVTVLMDRDDRQDGVELMLRVTTVAPFTCYRARIGDGVAAIYRWDNASSGIGTLIAQENDGGVNTLADPYLIEFLAEGNQLRLRVTNVDDDNLIVDVVGFDLDTANRISSAGTVGFFMNRRSNASNRTLKADDFKVYEVD